MSKIELKKYYVANLSGGKDSLYMFRHILENKDKYPLDAVVHFELEIDYPFIANVMNEIENICKQLGITYYSIKPRTSWQELYNKYGFPTRNCRWCNSRYKLDSFKQLKGYLNSVGYDVVSYIGYCFDEEKRYSKRKNNNEIYPLVELGIYEYTILEWAKKQTIFNEYYKYNKRCGCMFCPCLTYSELAYILKFYPKEYEHMIDMCRETELNYNTTIFQGNKKYNADYVDNVVRTKYLDKLEKML